MLTWAEGWYLQLSAELDSSPTQQPASVERDGLSQEDRERLREIADMLDREDDPTICAVSEEARFLRKLANCNERGEG